MDPSTPAPPPPPEEGARALETPDSDVDALESVPTETTTQSANSPPPIPPKKPNGLKQRLRKFNIYLLLFIFVMVIAGVIIIISYFQSQKASKTSTIQSQGLTSSTLQQLANSDATVGNPKQVLNVQSNAVFAGQVLVRESLQVGGSFQVNGTVTLGGLNVAGDTALQQVEIGKNISAGGNAAIQGQATIAQSLQVGGTGTFSGAVSAPQITTSSLQLNGDLTLTHHFIAGGGTPGRSNGAALGSGGTASVGGSDTAGLVSINTGGGPGAGCFVTVNFTSKYPSTPYVMLTPVGPAAGGLAYYVQVTSGSFSICDASTPPAGASFGFDYFVAG